MRPAIRWLGLLTGIAGAAILGASQVSYASDHDDGETELKSRSLNLTDHFAFVNGSNLVLTMYLNPRSLPDTQYFLNTLAHYEFHVSKAASDTSTPTPSATGADDYVFQFSAAAPDDTGAQQITLNLLEGGTMMGSATGMSTTLANSLGNTALVTNTGTAGTIPVTFFVGMRADAFTFDVQRYFQVRSFLANRFFGGPGGTTGNASASLEPTCDGNTFFNGTPSANGDGIHLFNPPECAPDFTKNYNVIAIVLSVPLANLSGTVFDTWSIITVQQ
jgi:hypothetical protein